MNNWTCIFMKGHISNLIQKVQKVILVTMKNRRNLHMVLYAKTTVLSPITQNWSVPNSNLPQWLVPYSNVPKLNCALFQCPTIELCLVPMPSKWIVPYSNVAKGNVPYSNAIKLNCALFQYHKMKCALFLFHQIEMCHSRINIVWMMREGTGDLALTYLRSFLSWRKWKCLL